MNSRRYDLWDKYFADPINDWDLWQDWNRDWIVERLHDDDVEETDITDEEIDYLLMEAQDYQKEYRQQAKEEAVASLRSDIEYAIEESEYVEHLDYDDIGKILCNLASSYFSD